MGNIHKFLAIAMLSLVSMASTASECSNQDDKEQFNCEFLKGSAKNLQIAHSEAVKVTGNNDSLRSVDELFRLQMSNCKNYKCKGDVQAMYYGVISGIPKHKVKIGGKKLSLNDACDATTKMRYFAAIAAYSQSSESAVAERQSIEFGSKVQVYDVRNYIKSYLSPVSNEFRQAYLEGDSVFQGLFVSMFGRCMSKPYEYLPTMPELVRSNLIDMGQLIDVYKKDAK